MFKLFYYLIKLKPSNAARWNQNENILLHYMFVIIEIPVYNDFIMFVSLDDYNKISH